MKIFNQPAREELKKSLTELQFKVTQEDATEPPFNNDYWNNHQAGIYVDVVTGEPLFSSTDKFESGSGWPSFTRPIDPQSVVNRKDNKLSVPRTEVRSRGGDSHLGHVFNDGPAPTGLRYCINSGALRFIPVDMLKREGYGDYLKLYKPDEASSRNTQKSDKATATLAGGCFWGVQELIRKLPGVIETTVGYTGGNTPNPTYEQVSTGKTGHAEAIQIIYDPNQLSYETLLAYFFRLHDPTTLNQQGHDQGPQYRSVIFYHDEKQRKVAEQVKARIDQSGKWPKKLVTEIIPASTFYPAESYHQDYLQKHPYGYTCHYLRD